MIYFSGAFIPKNIISNYLKGFYKNYLEDSICLNSLAKEYYDAFDILL